MPVGWLHRLVKYSCCVPVRTPEPDHVPTVTGEELLRVPPTNPGPVAVQVMFEAGMTLTPDRRSSAATTVSTTCAPGVARALAEMNTGPPVEGINGMASG